MDHHFAKSTKSILTSSLKYRLMIFSVIVALGCQDRTPSNIKPPGTNPVSLKIFFHPAFNENSEAIMLVSDSIKSIQILIRDDIRADKKQDTFWFKKVDLTAQQYMELDSTLIKMCRQKLGDKHYWAGCCDGLTINSRLTCEADSNEIMYRSRARKTDSIGYFFAESLFGFMKKAFQDSIVTGYFQDLETYVDDFKVYTPDPNRKIDQLRMRKYHWTIRKPSSK